MTSHLKSVTFAITGASGMPYAIRLLEQLLKNKIHIDLLISQAAQVVLALESELKLPSKVENLQRFFCDYYQTDDTQLTLHGKQEWTASIASGSGVNDAMIVCPCTMSTLASIATGLSEDLLERAADVTLKERKLLILVPRETPLSVIHLEHMLTLARIGAVILPASPGFYHKPESINDLVDFIVARILNQLNIPQQLIKPWGK